MAGWAAFVGLTVFVITLVISLAHLSQSLVTDGGGTADRSRAQPFGETMDGQVGSSRRDPQTDPVIPRFEPASASGEFGDGVQNLSTGALFANVALTQGLVGGLLLIGAFYFHVPFTNLGISGAPLSTGLLGVAVGVCFGIVLWVGNELASVAADATGSGYDESLRTLLAPDSPSGWVILLGAVLPTIAFVEEFLFRAAAIGALAAGTGLSPWLLAIVSSIAFGVAHGAQGRIGVAVTAILGFVLATGFVLTGSLLVVVIAHYLVNALEIGIHEGLGLDRVTDYV